MRTDVTIDTERELRIPAISIVGISPYGKAGTFIEWEHERRTCMGRVIGIVTSPEDGKDYFCTLMQMLGGCLCERWVDPEEVTQASSSHDTYKDKMTWLHSDDFLKADPDKARNAFNLLVEEMME